MALAIRNLSVRKDARAAVSDVTLTVNPGAVTAVLGANGAGKSELVLGLAGMLPVTAGTITLDGRNIAGLHPEKIRAAGVAAVPEGHRVLNRLSVDENLRAAGTIRSDGIEQSLADTYALFPELAERKNQIAETLSGGQQQMVALGHAVMSRPSFILIDEMSLGLAPLVVRRLMGFVRELKSRGVGVLLIEQFTDMALSVSEDAIVLRSGKVRYSGRAEILQNNKSLLDEAYFGIGAATPTAP